MYLAKYRRPLCRACYQRLFGQYCAFCDKPIEGACMEPQPGVYFHQNHFVCHTCGGSLAPGFVQKAGRFLCRACGSRP